MFCLQCLALKYFATRWIHCIINIFIADRGRLHPVPQCPWGKPVQNKELSETVIAIDISLEFIVHNCNCFPSCLSQVLGRKSPFPLILLPQFGGYWIEGTNHNLSNGNDPEQFVSPTSRYKLECNTTAKIYRKHFLGKVSIWLK